MMLSDKHPPTDRATLAAIAHQAMIERGLEPDFPLAVQHELAGIHNPAKLTPDVRDLRHLLWASIDNDDSLDLDQLTVAEPLANEQLRILVAIADVDALVRKGSALDAHAARNSSSVYTPAAIFPMLPESLSTDLTSLNENQDRIAVVADMVFAIDGTLVTSDIYRAYVHNCGKLAYHSVAAWLTGTGPAPQRIADVPGLDENLRLQDKIAQQLVKRRHAHGALSLETVQARPVFDGDILSDLEPDGKNRASQLIEDFMIAANGVAATFLEAKKFPSLRRVLRSPERWARLVQLAAGFGDHLPDEPDAIALESFLARQRTAAPDKYADLSLVVVKLIGRGEYVLDPVGGDTPGHFGLAVKDYTHSTAPNRRFPDLVTQRLLKAAIAGEPLPYSLAELAEVAKHCTVREDDASKVERRVRKSAAALLLSRRVGEQFDAVVTGAAEKGTWVRILRPPIEGKLVYGFKGLDVGSKLRVKLLRTDVEHGFIDFGMAPAQAPAN